MKRLLCLRLPNWPVQRLRVERQDIGNAPLVLHRRDPRRGLQVVAHCSQAARAGVRVGTSLAEATALVPTAIAKPFDPTADLNALGRLAEVCEQFSPKVGWETMSRPAVPWFGESPGHLFLDVTGLVHLFGGEEALAHDVVTSCREIGYACRLAVAETLGAAWAVAAIAEPVRFVRVGELDEALRPLPIESIRIPAETLDLLGRLGITTVEQLMRLSRVGLAERFGPALLACLDRTFGKAPEVIVPYRPPPKFEVIERFELPTDRRDVLEAALGEMIDRLAADLSSHGRGAVTLVGELGCGPDRSIRFEVGLYRPTDLAKPLRELVKLHCERLKIPGPVDRAALRAVATVRLRPRQEGLFGDPIGGAGDPLALLIARLSSRLGAEAVVRPVPQADALPERAIRFEPLVGGLRRKGSSGRVPASVHHRPIHLFTPPVRIEVEGDSPLTAFRWQGRHVIAQSWGPERIETGWWRRGGVRRDYYRVEANDGRRFWLFRDLVSEMWFLHGSFE